MPGGDEGAADGAHPVDTSPAIVLDLVGVVTSGGLVSVEVVAVTPHARKSNVTTVSHSVSV